jgi:hypothetical protein
MAKAPATANGATTVNLAGAGVATGTYLVMNDAIAGLDPWSDAVVLFQDAVPLTATHVAACEQRQIWEDGLASDQSALRVGAGRVPHICRQRRGNPFKRDTYYL